MADRFAALRDRYRADLERTLENTVVDFWHPRCIDEEHGGFIMGYDADGGFDGGDEKMLVTQSRMVWFFARLAREGYGDGSLDAAAQGYRFLRDAMHDEDHGGFYWITERDGTVTKPNKHLYGQSFALYGIAEYVRASGDADAEAFLTDAFETIDEVAYDADYGGYVEYFTPDWTPITDGRTYLDEIEPDWSPKESDDASLDPSMKLMNTHLHLLEAFTELYEVTEHERVRARLVELLHLLTNTVVRTDATGATPIVCTDKYAPDWTPKLDRDEYRIASYGHDLEAVWLTMDAAAVLGVHPECFRETYTALWDYTLEYGYDHEHGGVYFFGPLGEPASNRMKAWWVQAETLVSALRMAELTGDHRYADVFADTWAFVDEHLVDRDVGEWHSAVTDGGEPVGRKGAMYKGAYHNGRALLESMAALDRLAGAA